LVIGQGMRLAAIGAGAGLAGALLLTRLMSALLSSVTNTDPVTYLAVLGIVGGAVWLASALPARRAARIDPAVVLRGD
jgi:ABC-type antimicrobial peptide transport system permease subunit